jgi:uncharacterized protein (UPF0305 family)
MQAAELLNYINNPQLLSKQSIKPLQKLVRDFPYFQSAHVLLSLAAKKWDASVYQQSLKKTAIIVTNRSHLFQLIHQLENDNADHLAKESVAKEIIIETANENNSKETTKHELDILKATEISIEGIVPNETLIVKKEPLNPEDVLEKEIQHQVVNAFVEKEILKTPELHHPKQKREPESFVEWLYLLKKNNGQTHEQISEQVQAEKLKSQLQKQTPDKKVPTEIRSQTSKIEKHKAIIDKIIENNPGLIRGKEEQKFYSPNNNAKESLLENEHLVTETLAKIYALQGSVNKAVRAYEILSLKFPQKSAYFAGLIQKLKNNQ